jgi:hypothetical protein
MGINYFTPEQVKILSTNSNVKNVSQKAITYSEEFKRNFIVLKQLGQGTSKIFRDAGLDPDVLGKRRIHNFASRMKTLAERDEGTQDLRKVNSGRSQNSARTEESELSRLQHRIEYLEQENIFLKKIDFIERKAYWKQNQIQD